MNIGDVVTLINGLFDMTVREINDTTITCQWFTGTTLNTATFYSKDIIKKEITNG